ncbi:LysM peptidoglycan-binding domain-containing protein [Flavobacteriaceae bacterium TP-CH-4]|uniref:LysM peptidoglycan-binding domain-containing protein n=1 Tax=Pelagihabitans pacificus TaxID=2696054 RepID=A0A967APF7_9FLAO|nr:LysM peptidoglycan-binding domain-containing protein [Pelagihabitans pacificus]NHF58026.1 LysM peptidoglycan-binding domain-containing protein [Pelagihabitans pacificus]
MALGKLEKLKIIAFKNADYSDAPSEQETFTAMLNPETYSLDYKVEYQDGQGQGTSSSQQRFSVKKPEEFAFELLIDSSGIIDGKPRESIEDDITELRDLLLKYEGDIHEPKHFQVLWGSLLFKGRCTGLNINFKLFNPDGKPIRALCKVTFTGSVEDNLRTAEERRESPDMTHYRLIKSGDTLPMMCYKIYGSSSYYLQVAQVNKLPNFRNLPPGTEIFFPPITKNTPVA